MNIVGVEQILGEEVNGGPFTLSSLDALDSGRELYQAMLLQPHGVLEGTIDRVGHVDPLAALKMCRTFLDQAKLIEADLVVAPEYCIPWSVVTEIVQGHIQPRVGAIWALGCESITPQELQTFNTDVVASQDSVRLFHEPLDPRQVAQKKFIDPLLYVFWCVDSTGRKILCLLVQFKTAPCKDDEHIELTSLYLGKHVYKFNDGANKIGLLGIICSDAFNFSSELVEQHHRNTLILHIQLNQKPGHSDYASSRNHLFSVGLNSDSEVLCLNWAQNVKWQDTNGNQKDWGNISGSAWYIPPRKFDKANEDINSLHKDGLYHCLISKGWNAFYLNYAPHSILIRKQKVFSSGHQTLVQSVAPKVLQRRAWDAVALEWKAESAKDGFEELTLTFSNLQTLSQLCSSDPLAVERALELLEGPEGSIESWFKVEKLESLRVDVEESIRRVTVHQERASQRPGVKYRIRRIQRAQTAITLSGKPVPWPPALSDLSSGFRFSWTLEEPNRNIIPEEGGGGAATLIYLGEDPEHSKVESLYTKISTALHHEVLIRGILEGRSALQVETEAIHARDRLCLVFKRNHQHNVYTGAPFASFTEPGNTSPIGIADPKTDA